MFVEAAVSVTALHCLYFFHHTVEVVCGTKIAGVRQKKKKHAHNLWWLFLYEM